MHRPRCRGARFRLPLLPAGHGQSAEFGPGRDQGHSNSMPRPVVYHSKHFDFCTVASGRRDGRYDAHERLLIS